VTRDAATRNDFGTVRGAAAGNGNGIKAFGGTFSLVVNP
jgi:hypothetical protein